MAADPRRATESLADYLRRRAVDLERYAAGERRTVLRALAEIEREIRLRLEEYDPTGVTLTAARRRRLERLLEDTNARIAALMRNARDQFGESLGELADLEAAQFVAQMQTTFAATSIPDPVRLVPRNVLEALAGNALIEGAPIKDWWSRQSAGLRQRFTDQMRLGVAQGETLGQLIQRVRGTRANQYRDGVIGASRREAEALVRSSVNSVTNDARLAVYQQNADVIEALVHISTLDSRTTLQCAARDGKEWTINGDPIGGHGLLFQSPPIHWNCRSVIAPKVYGADRLPTGRRASADGPVPATKTFGDWLKGKSVAEQNAILGPERARLWRENKLTMAQLVDFRGEPLSLAELRRRYEAAPDPAELAERVVRANQSAKQYVLRRGRMEGVEHLVVIDDVTGEVIGRARGERSFVMPDEAMKAALLSPQRRVVAHHNHPGNNSLSWPDAWWGREAGGGIWAHAHDGSSYFITEVSEQVTQQAFDAVRARARRNLQTLISARVISAADAGQFHAHIIWRHFAGRGLVRYEHTFSEEMERRWQAFIGKADPIL